MKRLLIFFLLLSSFAYGQGYVNMRETPGGSFSYRRLLSSDIPLTLNYRYLKRRDTTLLTGAHQRTEIIVGLPNDDADQSSDILLSSKIASVGGDSTVSTNETYHRINLVSEDIGAQSRTSFYTGGVLEQEFTTGTNNSGQAFISGSTSNGGQSGSIYVDQNGMFVSTNGSPFNQGLKNLTDISATAVTRTLMDKGYIDAKIAQTITNGVTTSAPSQDKVFDDMALKAPLASPSFTGTPVAPTAASGTATTQIATSAFVDDAIRTTRIQYVAESTTSRTILSSDHGKVINLTNSGAISITLPNGLDAGLYVLIRIRGTGTATIAATTTLVSIGDTLTGDASQCLCEHEGSNVWVCKGDLTE